MSEKTYSVTMRRLRWEVVTMSFKTDTPQDALDAAMELEDRSKVRWEQVGIEPCPDAKPGHNGFEVEVIEHRLVDVTP